MQARNKPNEKMRQQIKALRDSGLETHQIADKLNISRGSVLQYERRMGYPKRKRGKPASPEIKERNEAVYQAFQKGYSYQWISERFNITTRYAGMIRYRVSEEKREALFARQNILANALNVTKP